MSVVINTNSAATIAANNLAYANSMLQDSLNKLSSGSKLVNPADDPGAVGVSMKLAAAVGRSGAANTNVENSASYLQTQDGVLNTAGTILTRISELYTLSQDPTKNPTDIANYNSEFTQLTGELSSLSSETFNGVNLFGSSAISVQVSEDGTQTVSLTGANLADSSAGVGALTASSITALSQLSGVSEVTGAIQNVATMIATNGALQARLGFASQVLTTNMTNLEAANSSISDVDVAQESTQLARWNVLVQAGTAMLAQANTTTQIALKLL
ncbi:MAG TPA: flagellin [Opitutaceae bacterium]|nr:flagellin [Opitutaceae bacterium]